MDYETHAFSFFTAKIRRHFLSVILLDSPPPPLPVYLRSTQRQTRCLPAGAFSYISLRLQFVLVDLGYLLRLYTQVIQSLPLCRVVEADHQPRNIHTECGPLMITPSLS